MNRGRIWGGPRLPRSGGWVDVSKTVLVPVPVVFNLSCLLQTLNGEGQQEADDLQLETSRRHRMDLPSKQRAQVTENRLDVLASGLAQKLLPWGHWPLGSLLALGLEVQADLF